MNEEGKLSEEQEHKGLFGLTLVFVISSIAIVIFIIGSLIFQEGATKLFGAVRVWLTTNFDWWFIDITNLPTVVLPIFDCIAVRKRCVSVVRTQSLSIPTSPGFAMLFSAGVGIGLLFFGVLEPIYHFQNPPLGIEKVYNPETVYTAETHLVPLTRKPRRRLRARSA